MQKKAKKNLFEPLLPSPPGRTRLPTMGMTGLWIAWARIPTPGVRPTEAIPLLATRCRGVGPRPILRDCGEARWRGGDNGLPVACLTPARRLGLGGGGVPGNVRGPQQSQIASDPSCGNEARKCVCPPAERAERMPRGSV